MQKLLFYFLVLINIIYTYQYIADSNYIKLIRPKSTDNYLNININLRDIKKCDICKLRVNINEYIPENCTIPIGCPFYRKNIN
jgi:hypothetical protein|tara:strand:+ start:203 stop:451 length:249 start_codon:yes stop_codon:yes gene_type:complete